MLCWYFCRIATEQELPAHLARLEKFVQITKTEQDHDKPSSQSTMATAMAAVEVLSLQNPASCS
jgi:hypothetical protein